MNYSLLDFLTLIGALGLFLYGMKLMSEALQKVAGGKLRNFLAAMDFQPLHGCNNRALNHCHYPIVECNYGNDR